VDGLVASRWSMVAPPWSTDAHKTRVAFGAAAEGPDAAVSSASVTTTSPSRRPPPSRTSSTGSGSEVCPRRCALRGVPSEVCPPRCALRGVPSGIPLAAFVPRSARGSNGVAHQAGQPPENLECAWGDWRRLGGPPPSPAGPGGPDLTDSQFPTTDRVRGPSHRIGRVNDVHGTRCTHRSSMRESVRLGTCTRVITSWAWACGR